MKILFYQTQIGLRGATQAVFDYAHFAETLLGHESVILFDETAKHNDPGAVARFRNRFKTVHGHREPFHDVIGPFCAEHQISLSYFLKAGYNDGLLAPNTANAVHATFQRFQPHGDAYAYVSDWLASYRTGGAFPAVPHIVQLPAASRNPRSDWGVPDDAYVFGRYGGFNTFDIRFVMSGIAEILGQDPSIWFVFVHTAPFMDHPRVVFLPSISDPVEKSNYLAACDAMLHARMGGESFGLAIAEFLYHGKPVLAWAGGKDRNHISMLDGAPLYHDKASFIRLALDYRHGAGDGFDWAARVAPYAPEAVMRRFQAVFVERGQGGAAISMAQRLRYELGFAARHVARALPLGPAHGARH